MDSQTSPVFTKTIFKTGHFWIGIAQIVYGILGYLLHHIDATSAVGFITAGLATIGFRFNTDTPATLAGGISNR